MPFTDSSYQTACEEPAQCTARLGTYAVCEAGLCDCQTEYHYSVQDGQCIKDVGKKTTLIIIIATGTRS